MRQGLVAIHPLDSADTTDQVCTSFSLETDDARAAEALASDGLPARWWDESYGRQAAVAGPGCEISVHEPMTDLYGYTAHRFDGPSSGFAVDVVAVFFTSHLDQWEAFFGRLGFTAVATAPGWLELRAGDDSGVIGLHASEASPASSERHGVSFKTSAALSELVVRMRGLGYEVTEEPEAQAPHVTVTDPDGERIEIHQR